MGSVLLIIKFHCKQEEKLQAGRKEERLLCCAANKRAVPSLSVSYCGLVALLNNRCV